MVPARPGITNALGCVVADLRRDFVRTINKPLPVLDVSEVRATLEAQIAEGEAMLAKDGIAVDRVDRLHFADMQFQGQSHMLQVALPCIDVSVAELRTTFEATYWRRFGVELPEIRAVLVNLHTAVIGKRPGIDLAALMRGEKARDVAAARVGTREVWFERGGWIATPIYARNRLPLDLKLQGPAIIEQLDTTIVVEPGDRVSCDAIGNLVVEVAP
jgi:N-methylhydantoinase A